MKTKLMGSVFVIIIAGFSFSGCSTDNPISPNSGNDYFAVSPIGGEDSRDQRGTEFRLSGVVIKFDADKSVMVLTAKMQSDRDETENDYTLEVSKNATVVLLSDRSEVAFDAKYVGVGTHLTAFGAVVEDGTMIVERFEIWQDDPIVDTNFDS